MCAARVAPYNLATPLVIATSGSVTVVAIANMLAIRRSVAREPPHGVSLVARNKKAKK